MADHQYDIHYLDQHGREGKQPVSTAHHHEQVDYAWWIDQVVDALKQIGIKVASDGISRVVYRGRR